MKSIHLQSKLIFRVLQNKINIIHNSNQCKQYKTMHQKIRKPISKNQRVNNSLHIMMRIKNNIKCKNKFLLLIIKIRKNFLKMPNKVELKHLVQH